MNWEALGAIAELLGALGVIATVVYLAVQIRHNTTALHSASYQHDGEQMNRLILAIVENPQVRKPAIAIRRSSIRRMTTRTLATWS